MTSTAAKATPHKLAIEQHHQGFDVAGIDGNVTPTWSTATPQIPEVGSPSIVRYADELVYLDGRYYAGVWDGVGVAYVFSVAVGDPAWTLEFTSPGGDDVVGCSFGKPIAIATDGTTVFFAFTVMVSVPVFITCGLKPQTSAKVLDLAIYSGSAGSWAALDAGITAETLNKETGSTVGPKLCASAREPGTCYLMFSETGTTEGINITTCGWAEMTWIEGFGASPMARVHIYQAAATGDEFSTKGYDPALSPWYEIANDGDQIQVFVRTPTFAGGVRAWDPNINVIEPRVSTTPVLTIPVNASSPNYFNVYPVMIEPGVTRRPIRGFFDSASVMTLRTLTDDAATLGHLHNNAALDAAAMRDGHANAFGDEDGCSTIYYDAAFDEYWSLSSDGAHLRTGVTNSVCPVPEVWEQFDVATAAGTVRSFFGARGRFDGDSFFACAITADGERPRVVQFPICRGCMDCSNA